MTRPREPVDHFRDSIARWFGLDFDEGKRAFLTEVLANRVGRSGCADAAAYVHRMATGQFGRDELMALGEELTVGETYFFRHPDQFRAFTDVVLPATGPGPRPRVLSAGCASGEEAYSLAILLREHAPAPTGPEARVVGLDLNPAALAKAGRGRYTAWSLRGVPEDTRRRYFHPTGKEFQLDASIRAMVSFEARNLLDEEPAFWHPDAFDVIFCRNVLMYFTPEATRAVVDRFTLALAPGGFLFLGPAETLRGVSHDYHLRHAHDAFFYQRRPREDERTRDAWDGSAPPALPGDTSWVEAIGRASERIARLTRGARTGGPPGTGVAAPRAGAAAPAALPPDLFAARELVRQERYSDALAVLGAMTDEQRQDPDAKLLRAVSLTNCGQVGEAEPLCHEVLAGDDLNPEARYLLALCLEHAGDYAAAAEQDLAAIYLDPRFAMPHLHLGLLRKRAGDRADARRAFRQASALLPSEEASRILLFGGGFSREALLRLCKAELRAGGGDT